MNMKNTMILLIFLLSILGLLAGVHYSGDIGSENSHESHWERIYEDHDGVFTVTLEKKYDHSLQSDMTGN